MIASLSVLYQYRLTIGKRHLLIFNDDKFLTNEDAGTDSDTKKVVTKSLGMVVGHFLYPRFKYGSWPFFLSSI